MLDPCPIPILNNAKSQTKLLLKCVQEETALFKDTSVCQAQVPCLHFCAYFSFVFLKKTRKKDKKFRCWKQEAGELFPIPSPTISHSLPGVSEISCLYVGENDPELLILLPPFLKFWTDTSLTSNLPVEYLIVKKPKVIGYKNKTNYQKHYIYPKA